MSLPRKKCKERNCNNPVWSNGLCQNHIKRKPIKSNNTEKITVRSNNKEGVNKRQEMVKRHTFFKELWSKRPHRSEVSKTPLGREPLSLFFHHILPRLKYPFAQYDEENIILLTGDEHADVESDMYKFDEVNRRRDELKKKYDLI